MCWDYVQWPMARLNGSTGKVQGHQGKNAAAQLYCREKATVIGEAVHCSLAIHTTLNSRAYNFHLQEERIHTGQVQEMLQRSHGAGYRLLAL